MPFMEKEWDDGEWHHNLWSDGNELVRTGTGEAHIFIERVHGPKSRRKRWVVTDRRGTDQDVLYPPKLAGPFKNLDVAKVTYLMLKAAG